MSLEEGGKKKENGKIASAEIVPTHLETCSFDKSYCILFVCAFVVRNKQLLQLCTARTACSDSVIRAASVRFGN